MGESVCDYGAKVVRLMAYQVEYLSGGFELIAHDDLSWLVVDDLNSVQCAPADVPLLEHYQAEVRD